MIAFSLELAVFVYRAITATALLQANLILACSVLHPVVNYKKLCVYNDLNLYIQINTITIPKQKFMILLV